MNEEITREVNLALKKWEEANVRPNEIECHSVFIDKLKDDDLTLEKIQSIAINEDPKEIFLKVSGFSVEIWRMYKSINSNFNNEIATWENKRNHFVVIETARQEKNFKFRKLASSAVEAFKIIRNNVSRLGLSKKISNDEKDMLTTNVKNLVNDLIKDLHQLTASKHHFSMFLSKARKSDANLMESILNKYRGEIYSGNEIKPADFYYNLI